MHVLTDDRALPEELGRTAVTIGKFDGLHLGHACLVSFLRDEAAARGLGSVVVTFDRHPLALFDPAAAPAPICSVEQKLELLRRQRVDAALVVPFTREFSRQDPVDFIREVLVRRLRAALVIVGRDFRFGAGGAGDVACLEEHADEFGYEVLVADDEIGPDGLRASSTRVRQLLHDGDVAGAARVLGRHHVVRGEVVHGAKRGRELGFPTANLAPSSEGLVPADGVYAGWLVDGDRVLPSAISVGDNPTFEGVPQRQVEAYVIDETGLDLYGRVVEVVFVDRIRGMVRFEGIEALVERMRADVDEARTILARPGAAIDAPGEPCASEDAPAAG